MTTETSSTILAYWSEDALRVFLQIKQAHQRLLNLQNFEVANDVTYLLSYGGDSDLVGTALTLAQLDNIYQTLVQFSTFLETTNGKSSLTPTETIYKQY